MKKNFLLSGLLLVLINFSVFATDYYFSSINGDDDSNTGTSPGSPWETVAKMQQTINSLQPGDAIHLERGSIWYQTALEFNEISGTSASPIQITAYGEGAMPVLSGEKILTDYVDNGSNIYTFTDPDIPSVNLPSQSYGRRFLGSVKVNGVRYSVSREPDGNSYLQSTACNNSSLTDNESWTTNQWQNGFIAMQNVKYQWSTVRITSNTSNTLSTTDHCTKAAGIYPPSGVKFYYFLNAYDAMDEQGEWFFNDGVLLIYWEGELDQVKASVVDRIINIVNSDYLEFDNLEITGANFYGVKIQKGDYNKFNLCRIKDIGQIGIYIYGESGDHYRGAIGDSENNEVTNCEFSDNLHCSIFSRYARGGIFTNNYIHRNALEEGYHNLYDDPEANEMHGYAIAVFNNLGLNPLITKNFIDETAAGIITHYNPFDIEITNNFIRNYGMTERGDLGAFYIVSDEPSVNKSFDHNIILDAHAPVATLNEGYTDEFTHAVYFDQKSYHVHADYNTIENAQLAIFLNSGIYRSFSHNNVLNPLISDDLHDNHKAAISHCYNFSLKEYPEDPAEPLGDVFTNNNIVFSDLGEVGYKFARDASEYGCEFPKQGQVDYNNYFDLNGTSVIVATIYNVYSQSFSYTMDQWQEETFDCGDETYDPGENSSYDATHDNAKLFKNFSASNHTFSLSEDYVDVDGIPVTGSVTVDPFYSVLLFPVSGNGSGDEDLYFDETLIPMLPDDGPNEPPTADNVTILGDPEVGVTLTGQYEYYDAEDPEGNSQYQWYYADPDEEELEVIMQATDIEYELTSADLGKYMVFEVTPVAEGGQYGQPAQSEYFGPITDITTGIVLLTVNIVGNGDVSRGSGGVIEGTPITITAFETDPDWHFVEWTGDVPSTELTIEVLMDDDKEVTAVFEPNERIIQVNFGHEDYTTPEYWNEIISFGEGGNIGNLMDTENEETNYSLQLENAWDNFGDYGSTSGIFPDEVRQTYFYTEDNEAKVIVLSGLNPNSKYDISIFASRQWYSYTTHYTIGNSTKSIYVWNNEDDTVTFKSISPVGTENEIEISCQKDVNSTYGYINAMVIKETSGSTPPDPDPPVDYERVAQVNFSAGTYFDITGWCNIQPRSANVTYDFWEFAPDEYAQIVDLSGLQEGTRGVISGEEFPDHAAETYHYTDDNDEHYYELQNLPCGTYRLRFFASRTETNTNRITHYTYVDPADGSVQTVELDANNNSSVTELLDELVPDEDGNIEFSLRKDAASKFGYINLLEVYFRDDGGNCGSGGGAAESESIATNGSALIYPNPVHDNLYIAEIPSGSTVCIYNMLGELQDEIRNNDFSQIMVPVSDYNIGTYIIKISGDDKRLSRQYLIVKQ